MEILSLQNDHLALEVLPEVGGKISSLRMMKSGHQWFWRNPYLTLRRPTYGESYIEHLDFGGWDEIFPSINPCQLNGLGPVPDHGDLVGLPWTLDFAQPDILAMSVRGRCWPYTFERKLQLCGNSVRLEYVLENTGTKVLPWIWCAHSLISLCVGLKLEFTDSTYFNVHSAGGDTENLSGKTISWDQVPEFGKGIWALKMFTQNEAINQVVVHHPQGHRLAINWDASLVPHLGLWINHGWWSGCGSAPYSNIGIEPATVPADDLSQVINPPMLEPGHSRRWFLELSVE